jgi:hypothetical protein
MNLPVYYPVARILWQALGYFWQYLLVTVAAFFFVFFVRRKSKQSLIGVQHPVSYWLEIVRLTLVVLFSTAFHFMLKSCIYLLNSANYDAILFQMDQMLHFGIAPCFFFVELFKSPAFYRFMDIYYSPIYFLIVLLYSPAILVFASTFLKRTFASAYVLTVISGLALYVAIPSWGPVFIYPEQFQEALQHMPITVTVQRQLHKETLSLIRTPMGRRTIRNGGIAAFPSLHVALLTLFTLTTRTISKRWFHINILLTILMTIGTMVTGYHYLIDGYAGVLLAYGCFKFAEWWQRRWDVHTVRSPGNTQVV